jgi:hypothetical protein
MVLDMIAHPDLERGIVILDSARAAAYCMPGLQRRTVVTTAALHALSDDELSAVLAHERAHIAEHNELALAFPVALVVAFAGLPPFRIARCRNRTPGRTARGRRRRSRPPADYRGGAARRRIRCPARRPCRKSRRWRSGCGGPRSSAPSTARA